MDEEWIDIGDIVGNVDHGKFFGRELVGDILIKFFGNIGGSRSVIVAKRFDAIG